MRRFGGVSIDGEARASLVAVVLERPREGFGVELDPIRAHARRPAHGVRCRVDEEADPDLRGAEALDRWRDVSVVTARDPARVARHFTRRYRDERRLRGPRRHDEVDPGGSRISLDVV